MPAVDREGNVYMYLVHIYIHTGKKARVYMIHEPGSIHVVQTVPPETGEKKKCLIPHACWL